MIVLHNLSFSYSRKVNVIRDLNLSLPQGTICGLLGKNGVGKSTILYLLSGLLFPTTGSVECNGFIPGQRRVDFLNDIFMVPEEFNMPDIPLEDYILHTAPFYPQFSREDMERYLTMFGLSTGIHLGRLSLGQKKKAFLSFAMACNTSILLLDEPTNGLDITSKRIFRQVVSSCMSDDKIIIISTHQVYDVEKILDHVVIADNERILLNASMMDITNRLSFNFTTDRDRIQNALIAVDAPGGANIVEYLDDPDRETEVNLESLFELAQNRPDIMVRLNSTL